MKVIKIAVYLSTGYVGSRVEDELELYFDEDATEDEIEIAKANATREWLFDRLDWGWNVVE